MKNVSIVLVIMALFLAIVFGFHVLFTSNYHDCDNCNTCNPKTELVNKCYCACKCFERCKCENGCCRQLRCCKGKCDVAQKNRDN